MGAAALKKGGDQTASEPADFGLRLTGIRPCAVSGGTGRCRRRRYRVGGHCLRYFPPSEFLTLPRCSGRVRCCPTRARAPPRLPSLSPVAAPPRFPVVSPRAPVECRPVPRRLLNLLAALSLL